MSLEQLYNNASTNTYVGTVRTRQEASAPTNGAPLVNFLDGQPKTRSTQADVFQTEFTRNRAGQFVAGGAQGVQRNPTQEYTRWTEKSFKLAFDGEGPPTLAQGYYTNRFRTDTRTNSLVHMYTPATGKSFGEKNTSANARIVSSPSGAPTGF